MESWMDELRRTSNSSKY